MDKWRDTLAIMVAGVACGFSGFASAEPPNPGSLPNGDLLSGPSVSDEAAKEPPRRPGERMARRAESEASLREWMVGLRELNLTDEQRQSIRGIAGEFYAQRREFLMSRSESERALIDDLPAMRQQQRMPNAKQREMIQRLESQRPKVDEYQRRMWEILTPQQQNKFKAKMSELRERTAQRRPNRGDQRRDGDGAPNKMTPMQPNTAEQRTAAPQSAGEPRRDTSAGPDMAQRRMKFLRSRQSSDAKGSVRHAEGAPSPNERKFRFNEDQPPPRSEQ
jgi:Spy/CpxP family protein refolding chaperone